MNFKILKYSLKQVDELAEISIYIENIDTEFSTELLDVKLDNQKKENIQKNVVTFIRERLPGIKKANVKILCGTIALFSFILDVTSIEAKQPFEIVEKAERSTNFMRVWVNDKPINLNQKPVKINDTIYLPISDLCSILNIELNWDSEENEVLLKRNDDVIRFDVGEKGVIFNDESLDMPRSVVHNNMVLMPIRFISDCLGYNTQWDAEAQTIKISDKVLIPREDTMSYDESVLELQASNVATNNYTEEDLNWLSKLVHAEAEGESYEGKLAVANVILNRKKSDEFPSTVKDVIFDNKHSVQFTPTIDGRINNTPNDDSVKAAKEALEGTNNAENAIFFLNPQIAQSNWISTNKVFAFKIGEHHFYC